MKPYVVRDGDDLAQIAQVHGCGEDQIWDHPKNQDLRAEREAKDELRPGDVLHLPARKVECEILKLEQPNPLVGRKSRIILHIEVLDASGAPEPVGTPFRLSVAGKVLREASLTEAGKLVEEEATTYAAVKLEWGALPDIEYAPQGTNPGGGSAVEDPLSEISPSRESIFTPGTAAEMESAAGAELQPAQVEFADVGDRYKSDCVPFFNASHPHHYLARKVDLLVATMGGQSTSDDPQDTADNRWMATHPLYPHLYLIPTKKGDAGDPPAAYVHVRDALKGVVRSPDGPDGPRVWSATARAGEAWYSARGSLVPFMGSVGSFSRGGPKPFMNLLDAVHKRLVTLWIGELKAWVPSADHDWLTLWLGTAAGRAHFKNWCQLISRIGHWNQDGGPHAEGAATDIDREFNPWAPLFDEKSECMTGEKVGNTNKKRAAVGMAYDRALRLFVDADGDLSVRARLLATTYFRNEFDWTPSTIHQVYCQYQALSWSLISYFDYRFDRASVPKSPALGSNASCSRQPDKRGGVDLWKKLVDEHAGLHVHPDARLLLSASVAGKMPDSLAALLTREEIEYPFKSGNNATRDAVYLVPLGSLDDDLSDSDRLFLGDAIGRQIDADHTALHTAFQRDPCRGLFNMSYDVVMAFGRMLSEEEEYRRMCMFSFGSNPDMAAGGDFMHIDYRSSRGMRW